MLRMVRDQGKVIVAWLCVGTELWEAGGYSLAGGAAGLVAIRDRCFGEMFFCTELAFCVKNAAPDWG